METKEQKIERLKKQIEDKEKYLKDTPYLNETIKLEACAMGLILYICST